MKEQDKNKKWNIRFSFYQQLEKESTPFNEIHKSPTFKKLSRKDKILVRQNFAALIFSFIYYFYKGLHLKALALFTISIVWVYLVTSFEVYTQYHLPSTVFWLPVSCYCMMFANIDVYKKFSHAELMWPSWPKVFHSLTGGILTTLVCLIFIVFAPYPHPYNKPVVKQQPNGALEVVCGSKHIYMSYTTYTANKENLCDFFSTMSN